MSSGRRDSFREPVSKEKADAIAKRTFTAWINARVSKHGMEIENLETDLDTGVVLCVLLEELSNMAVGTYTTKVKNKFMAVANLNTAMDFLKDKAQLSLVNIGAEDIQGHNLKIIMGLIWQLIIRFQLQGEDGQGGGEKAAKAAMLNWLRSTLGAAGSDVSIDDFKGSFMDGKAFLAILNALDPTLLTEEQLACDDARTNLELAFDLAEEHFNVPRILDVDDMLNGGDERAVLTYVSEIFKAQREMSEARMKDLAALREAHAAEAASKAELESTLEGANARIAELEARIAELEAALADALADAAAKAKALEELQAKYDELAAADAAKAKALEELQAKADDLAAADAAKAAELDKLRDELAAARAAADDAANSADQGRSRAETLSSELDDANAAAAKTRAELDDAKNKIDELAAALAAAEAARSRLRAELDDALARVDESEGIEPFDPSRHVLRSELDAALRDAADARDEAERALARARAAETRADDAEAELDDLRRSLAAAKRKAKDAAARAAAAEEDAAAAARRTRPRSESTVSTSKLLAKERELAAARSAANDKDAELARMRSQLEAAAAALERERQSAKRRSRALSQAPLPQDMDDLTDELEAAKRAARKAERRLAELEAELAAANDALDDAAAANDALKANAAAQIAQLRDNLQAQLNAALAAKDREMNQLREALAAAEADRDAALRSAAGSSKEASDLRARVKELELELERAAKDAAAKAARAKRKYDEQIRMLTEKSRGNITLNNNNLKLIEQLKAANRKLSDESQVKEGKISTLTAELSTARNELARAESRNEVLSKDNARVKLDLQDATSKAAAAVLEAQRAVAETDRLAAECRAKDARLASMDAQLTAAEDRLVAERENTRRATTRAIEAEAEIEALKAAFKRKTINASPYDIEELLKTIEELKADKAKFRKKWKKARTRADVASGDARTAQQRLAETQTALSDAQASTRAAKSEAETASRDLTRVSRLLERADQERDDLDSRLLRSQSDVSSLRNRVSELEIEVARSRRAAGGVSAEELAAAKREADSEIARLRAEVAHLVSMHDEAKKKLTVEVRARGDLDLSVGSLKDEVRRLERKIRRSDNTIADLEAQLEAAQRRALSRR